MHSAQPAITKPEITPAIEVAEIKKIEPKKEVQITEPGGLISELIEPNISLSSPSSTASLTLEEREKIETSPKKNKLPAPVKIKEKKDIIKIDKKETRAPKKPVSTPSKQKKELIKKPIQTQLPLITTEKILEALSKEWLNIKDLIFKMKIKDMMDARFLQVKLKELERKDQILMDVKMGKKHWKLK